jgi:transposase
VVSRPPIEPLRKLKQFRRIATRYEKLAATFLAFIHVTAAFIMIR